MKITEIQVDDFGTWHGLSLRDLDADRPIVLYGPNEAGKTTLLNFIRTVLYGFSPERCERYLPSAEGCDASGSLYVSAVNGPFQVQRTAPANYRGGAGNLSVRSLDGGHQGQELLTSMLAGVDETIFNNVFAVGLTQLQQLATLSDTEAANQLYGLASGVDRVSLYDVTSELEAQRQSLLANDSDQEGQLDRLWAQHQRLQRELKQLRRDDEHCTKLRKEYQQLTRKVKQHEAAQKRFDGEGSWSDLSTQLRQHWDRCGELNHELSKLGPLVDIPQPIRKRIDELNGQITKRRRKWEQLREERRRLKAQAQKLQGQDILYRHAAEIEALDRQRPGILALEEDVARRQAQVDELEFELQAELEELGLQVGNSGQQIPEISDRVIEALRHPARETRELRQLVNAAKKAVQESRHEAKRLQDQLDAAVLRLGGENVSAASQRCRQLVTQLEHRLALDEQREHVVRRLDELEGENRHWLGRGVLPWRGILLICAIFAAGAMLLLTGLLGDWFQLDHDRSWAMMLIGGSLTVVSLVIKGAFEQSALQRADACEHQIDVLYQQQQQTQEESDELDSQLPTGLGNLDERLESARRELNELDQFLPLRHRLQDVQREAEAARQQATLAVRQLKESRRVWTASLRTVGFPDTLAPSQIGQMSGRVGPVTRLRRLLTEAQQELEQRQQELATIRERIEQLHGLAEKMDMPDGLGPQLDELLAKLEKHVRSGRERDQMKESWEALGQRQQRIATAAEPARNTRRKLLIAHGMTSVRDYHQSTTLSDKAEHLRSERDALLQRIADALGDDFDLNSLRQHLDEDSSAVMGHLGELDVEFETLGSHLGALYERCGELKQRLEAQIRDRRREKKALAIQAIQGRIDAATQEWLKTAWSSAILEQVRENYEMKRQPVTLAEASRFLDRLTEGRYIRVWTPLGQSALCVEDHQSQSLPVEKLSRGTREQLFLALLLALITSYQRRGATMPFVLDDVFVNFDDQRARAAAVVLSDVAAAGQQMFILTCHQRIRDIFSELGGDVRNLPKRLDDSAHRIEASSVVDADVLSVAARSTAALERPAKDTDVDLPTHDVKPGDETLELLAMPTERPSRRVEHGVEVRDHEDDDDEWIVDPEADSLGETPPAESPTRFTPAWRDECLEPLPDLAPVNATDEDDAWFDEFYLGKRDRTFDTDRSCETS